MRNCIIGIVLVAGLLLAFACAVQAKPSSPEVSIFALRYGVSDFPENNIFLGGDADKTRPFAWSVYLIRYGNKNILIDTGFDSPANLARWKINSYTPVLTLLAKLGQRASSISHVILTHSHVDHAGLIGSFRNARFYLTDKTFERLQSSKSLSKGVERVGEGLFTRFSDRIEVVPGLFAFHVGGHTADSTAVEFSWGEKTFLFPSDNCYLIENCRGRKPIGSVKDSKRNQEFIEKYSSFKGVILPHHDPSVFSKFTEIAPNIVEVFNSEL